ncbi:MAG: GNAT family N-acetyltransferase [Rhodospirillaceae bacterium]|jgi:methionyl-tRNA formyltransferase|nr:GNAT family N-acetyltransferase [Rhodospirillaceae bacterium]MBT5458110.1 GNAT family N-acetyltransferase [Rhodospirillaceae bacterium]MBT5895105.1 GNAT family N-acetyltransferase [Rhodospirillaceae bacterium]MBT7756926.1 GNAT family N-acetyltransferase [Rhodospirillaceae bacterium]
MSKLKFRKATLDDAPILFSWVNSPTSLSARLETSEAIPLDTHLAWLKTRISDVDTGIWLASLEDQLVGQVRLQLIEGAMDIDVFVVAEYRRKDIATQLLEFAKTECMALWPGRSIMARIRHENIGSKMLFSKSGYSLATVRDEQVNMTFGARSVWWNSPRNIRIVVDNPSWITHYVEILAQKIKETGDEVRIVGGYDSSENADITFLLGCVNLAPDSFLCSSNATLVVHESDLPAGRGFSPLTWRILEGGNTVPICLFYAVGSADAGPVIFREELAFEGHELIDELRERQGQATIELCMQYLRENSPALGEIQIGEPTHNRRRTVIDSKLDARKSIADQFNLLRTVDNNRFPAYFELGDHTYTLEIKKIDRK